MPIPYTLCKTLTKHILQEVILRLCFTPTYISQRCFKLVYDDAVNKSDVRYLKSNDWW